MQIHNIFSNSLSLAQIIAAIVCSVAGYTTAVAASQKSKFLSFFLWHMTFIAALCCIAKDAITAFGLFMVNIPIAAGWAYVVGGRVSRQLTKY